MVAAKDKTDRLVSTAAVEDEAVAIHAVGALKFGFRAGPGYAVHLESVGVAVRFERPGLFVYALFENAFMGKVEVEEAPATEASGVRRCGEIQSSSFPRG